MANDESRVYRTLLDKSDAELHRAIRLAAHGVGIGSFVYLRRILERLIYQRFKALQATTGWSDDEFRHRRMDEKIYLLKEHLSEFLVQTKGSIRSCRKEYTNFLKKSALGFFNC